MSAMPDLTHAVYDALTLERVSDPMTTDAAFGECSRLNRTRVGGYVVGLVSRPPAVYAAASNPEPEYVPEPADEDGPGLFD